MVIRLTSEIERALIGEARQRGVPPEELALESLRNRFVPPDEGELPSEVEVQSLADYLGGHIGAVHSGEHVPGGAALSQDSAGKFVESLRSRRPSERS
ncbi:MAG: hypothetical protein WD066_17125 [Planctomycetaceae bacterium]